MEDLTALRTALDQAAAMLERVGVGDLARPTPCTDWNVGAVVDHVVAAPGHFVSLMRGEKPDWSAPPPHRDGGWTTAFRESSAELLAAWESAPAGSPTSPAWQCAELAIHTWDLGTALGVPLDGLDPAPAEEGLSFMVASLKPEMRQGAFGPERPASPGASAYDRIAAFAGRTVP